MDIEFRLLYSIHVQTPKLLEFWILFFNVLRIIYDLVVLLILKNGCFPGVLEDLPFKTQQIRERLWIKLFFIFPTKEKKGKPLQPIICVGKCSDIFTKKMNISYFMWNELTCFFDIIITVWKIVGLECKVSIYHFPYLCCRWNLDSSIIFIFLGTFEFCVNLTLYGRL